MPPLIKSGEVYVCKGSASLLNWYIYQEELPTPLVLIEPTAQELRQLEVPIFEARSYIIIATDSLPKDLRPDEEVWAFVVLEDYRGSKTKEQKKIYKSSGYTQIDLNNIELPETFKDYPDHSPCYIKWCLDQKLTPTPNNEEYLLTQYLKMLGSREAINEWASMPPRLIWSSFFTPDLSKSWAYKILTGLNKSKPTKGMCPQLWA
jgi:hypothetical protein